MTRINGARWPVQFVIGKSGNRYVAQVEADSENYYLHEPFEIAWVPVPQGMQMLLLPFPGVTPLYLFGDAIEATGEASKELIELYGQRRAEMVGIVIPGRPADGPRKNNA